MQKFLKTLCAAVLLFCILGFCSNSTVHAAYFTDVKPGAWYYNYVQDVSDKGLMHGYSNNKFGPDDTLTRGQFATILYRIENEPYVTFSGVFRDVAYGQYYSAPVEWAFKENIISGYSSMKFGPNDPLTREQLVTIMYRYASYKGDDVSQKVSYFSFSDAYKVSSYASEAMQWGVGSNIISGVGNNRLDPQGSVTRAMCATIISRYTEKGNQNDPVTPTPPTPSAATEGVYTFYNKTLGYYLSYNGNTLTLSNSPAKWKLTPYANNAFYVYANGTNLLFDIDNAVVRDGTTIKLWERTGYNVQMWYVSPNTNGTFSFLSYANDNFCLGYNYANGKIILQNRNTSNKTQEWELVKVEDVKKDYLTYTSTGGIIELQLPLNIHSYISKAKLLEWANNLETAYYTFYELTNFKPYDKIYVDAYHRQEYIAYVYDGVNVIYIDSNFLYEDLTKMSKRSVDWNFCALHEMGHMFDWDRPWTFEAELMTDLKVAYVLERNNAAAAPSEFNANTVFYGSNIINAYNTLGSSFSSTYDIYGCAKRFLDIKNDIGWEPFKKAFHTMQNNYNSYNTSSNEAKLNNLIYLLAANSGKSVSYIKSYFTTAEWNTILREIR